MATGIILALFAGLPWWLPALVSALHRLGVVAEWEMPEKRPVGNTDEPPAPGKVTGGNVTSKLPRRLSAEEATDEEFLDELNGEPEAEEIVAQRGLETVDVDAEVVEFNLADAYAKAEVSMEQQAARMERMRKEIELRKKKMK